MKRWNINILAIVLLAIVLFMVIIVSDNALSVFSQKTEQDTLYDTMAKRDLLALMIAYPEYIKSIEKGSDGLIYVIMKSGEKIVYDDEITKNYYEKLACADLQDMMQIVYPLEDIETLMEENFDPGRIRCHKFLKEIYGNSQRETESFLKSVRSNTGIHPFNGNNKAAQALSDTFRQISELINNDSGICGFVYPLGGTYNYRVIAGTSRLSPHAFGIAIDLASDPKDYWRWVTRAQGQQRLNSYPREIVRAFEENGFIWGGKWAHFDILHFEYRPELIIKSRCNTEPKGGQAWYMGFPRTEEVAEYIDIIEIALE